MQLSRETPAHAARRFTSATYGRKLINEGDYVFNSDAAKVYLFGAPGVNAAANSMTVFHGFVGDVDGATQVRSNFTTTVNTAGPAGFRVSFDNPAN